MFNRHLVKENEALRQELHMLKQVRESFLEETIYLRLDHAGRIEFVNQHFQNELGYTAVSYTHLTLPTNREV